MGWAKQQQLEELGRGWSSINEKHVCSDCFGDEAIQVIICENASSHKCSYCETESHDEPIACDMNVVMETIANGIKAEYNRAVNEVGRIDGEWVGCKVFDSTWELVEDELELGIENDELFEDVIDSLGDDAWCQRDPYGPTEDQELYYDWESFTDTIKHRNRYFFYAAPGSVGSPLAILDSLAEFVTELDMISTLPRGFSLFRGQKHDDEEGFHTAERLGSPPPEHARFANRMSAVGIPMFYGSNDTKTVLAEVCQDKEPSHFISIGEFKTLQNFKVLDLTRGQIAIPSLFDEDKRQLRPVIRFLRAFLDDFTKPVEKNGLEHIEYVPTQVVTEYFRYVYRTEEGENLAGIVYPSAVHKGGRSYVLFFTQEDCCGTKLELESSQVRKL